MSFFTTDFNKLYARLEDSINNSDSELALNTFESITKFHPQRPLPYAMLDSIADLAYSRRFFFLASLAYERMFEGIDVDENIPSKLALPAQKLGLILTQHTLLLQKGLRYLLSAQKSLNNSPSSPELSDEKRPQTLVVSRNGEDAGFDNTYDNSHSNGFGSLNIEAEINRVTRILNKPPQLENDESEPQSVFFIGYSKLPDSYNLAQHLNEVVGLSKYEFSRRLAAKNGFVAKAVANASIARDIVRTLGMYNIPTAYLSDRRVNAILPLVRHTTTVGILETGIEIGVGIHAPRIVKWENIEVIDAGVVDKAITQREQPTMLKRSIDILMSDGHGAPDPSSIKSRVTHVNIKNPVIVLVLKDPNETVILDLKNSVIKRPCAYLSSVPITKEEWLAEEILCYAKHSIIGLGAHQLSTNGLKGNWSAFTYRNAEDFFDKIRWMLLMKKYFLSDENPADTPRSTQHPRLSGGLHANL